MVSISLWLCIQAPVCMKARSSSGPRLSCQSFKLHITQQPHMSRSACEKPSKAR